MVRSKQKSAPIPLYHAKKYRQMAQRHMTNTHNTYTDTDDDKDIDTDMDTHDIDDDSKKKKQKMNTSHRNEEPQEQILSDEFLQEYGSCPGDDMILHSRTSSSKSKQQVAVTASNSELTRHDIKVAKEQKKQQQRKRIALQQRQEQKQKRTKLYQQLQQYSIVVPPPQPTNNGRKVPAQNQKSSSSSSSAYPTATSASSVAVLMTKSSQLNVRMTKRQLLQRAFVKEQMNLPLSNMEHELLYDNTTTTMTTTTTVNVDPSTTDSFMNSNSNNETTTRSGHSQPPPAPPSQLSSDHVTEITVHTEERASADDDNNVNDDTIDSSVPPKTKKQKTSSVAEQMMASIVALQTHNNMPTATMIAVREEGTTTNKQLQNDDTNKNDMDTTTTTTNESLKPSSSSVASKKYVPTTPILLQTTPSYYKDTTTMTTVPQRKQTMRNEIQCRPLEVQELRNQLPVVQMEYEIMDLIQNHDICIICSETGSGKSTQIPQFLYEAGYSSSSNCNITNKNPGNSNGGGGMIGITQPRRVAAISSAKRVCYEMGQGNGQCISGRNLVSYQTRYETAGYDANTTQLQFMTDGILLQEIKNDLLLRKYNVIVLDEAHERNLNTDILIGLLSIAIPLRNTAARASSHCQPQQHDPNTTPGTTAQTTTTTTTSSVLRPLKLIIMSATLRVEDFTTSNPKLFPHHHGDDSSFYKPGVITIPGRTHPVTVHHNKVTELYNYEDAVFQKVCKIHRQLPPGGILVFLTGKQEIISMVNRLRRALQKGDIVATLRNENDVVAEINDNPVENDENYILRDMDDDEVDGDIWQVSETKSENCTDDIAPEVDNEHGNNSKNDGSQKPLKTIILPLYSLLTAEQQARVFAPIPDGYRLIVVATNIAETSLTIPGITYVVDSGRQKCRNYNATTGVSSFDIMWISKAAADQRAGRAGRTGPGHCYRIYSSSLYSRHMDAFALPEVLTRPLEDVVLSMKAMNIINIHDFPFPTPPDRSQIDAAIRLLANLGCLDISMVDIDNTGTGCDGVITRLGSAVTKLPLGVRYSKMLLVAAEAGILDYAIPVVAALSEVSPFVVSGQTNIDKDSDASAIVDEIESTDETTSLHGAQPLTKKHRWSHKSGDVLAAMLAVGAYSYAGRGVGGRAEKVAGEKFCHDNRLHPVVMERIQQMRRHLSHLAKSRLSGADGIVAKTGRYTCSMSPPNKVQERLLCQSIASGLLDNIAMLAPLGTIPGQHPFSLRSAYLSCSSNIKEPLFVETNSVVHSRDSRQLPKWVCYESLIRKTLKDGITSIAIMKKITPIDPSWLGRLAEGSRLLAIGEPLVSPLPTYDPKNDVVLCSVQTKFGCHGWEIVPVQRDMFKILEEKKSAVYMPDDSFRWFARFLLEGKVFKELKETVAMYSDHPSIITRRQNLVSGNQQNQVVKVTLLASALSQAGIDNAAALQKHWAEINSKFLFHAIKRWVKPQSESDFQTIWIKCVKANVQRWNNRNEK